MKKSILIITLFVFHSLTGLRAQEVASLEYNTDNGVYNSIVQVDSDTYVLAYSGAGYDGYIKTFTISSDGATITPVASLEHDTDNGVQSSIVQVDSDTYVLAYSGPGLDGYIKTFTVSSDGTTITPVASLEHDTDNGTSNSIVQVDSDTYVLAYTGTDQDGYIKTFTIPTDGSSITQVASLEHDTVYGVHNSIVQVDSDTYVLAYAGSGSDGYIKTFTISSDGATITPVASQEHDTDNGTYNSIVQVDSDTYILAYAGSGSDGYIKTFTISSDGTTITEVEELEHDTQDGNHNSIVQVDSDTYVLAYAGSDADGYIKTFTAASDGTLPVELTSFHVLSTSNDAVTLQWVTESEINNLGFILDRRAPGTDWAEIATYITHPELQGQGSVTHQSIYSYTDNTVLSAETYDYRLADVDYDGNKEYHSMTVLGVSPSGSIPETFMLQLAYPNPFNPITSLRYDLPEQAQVILTVYNLMGREITQLVNTTQEAGFKSIQWNATDTFGKPVSAGVYLYQIRAGEFVQTRKMVLLK